jgi:F-box and WD-40 domain protein 1/11
VRVWDFETGHQMFVLNGHTNRVFRVQFDFFKIITSSQVCGSLFRQNQFR